MLPRPRAILQRLRRVAPLALVVIAGLLSYGAADGRADGAADPAAAAAKKLPTVVVPELRHRAYVFAKGALLDGGFAWIIDGPTRGYPGNLVVEQSPAPGTRVVATGAPTIKLTLTQNPAAPEIGNPEEGSPYSGIEALTPAELVAKERRVAAEAVRAAAAATRAAERARLLNPFTRDRLVARARLIVGTVAAVKAKAKAHAVAKARATAKAKAKANKHARAIAKAKAKAHARAIAQAKAAAQAKAVAAADPAAAAPGNGAPALARPPAFPVVGAPVEPVHELSLDSRARQLADWIAQRPPFTAANSRRFLYQHAWVVAGARFGWWHGAEALRILIAADTELARRWPAASARLAEARAVLADVLRRTAAVVDSPAPPAQP